MALDAKLTCHNLLFNYLRLLGMDTETLSVKHRTPFDRSMMVKPNRKAFEVVAYFLFKKLDAERTQREFRDAWPVFDKKQETQFRKIVQAWLAEIQSKTTYFPRINPAILLSPGGDKFCELLCYLAYYVIDTTLNHDGTSLLHPEYVKSGYYAHYTTKIISANLAENLSSLLTIQGRFLSEYSENKRLANELITGYRQDRAYNVELTHKLENIKAYDPEMGKRLLNLEDKTICDELLLKTQENQLILEEELNKLRLLQSEERELWKMLQFLFEKKNAPVMALDGLVLLEKIPTEVLEDFQRKQAMLHREMELADGNISVIDLMRLLTTVQDYYKLPFAPDNLNERAECLGKCEREHRRIVEQLAKEVKRLEYLRKNQIERLKFLHSKLADTISEGRQAIPPVTPYRPLLPEVLNTPGSQPELFRMTPAIAETRPLQPVKKTVLQREVRGSRTANASPHLDSTSLASPKARSQSSLTAKHYAPDLQKKWQIKKQQQSESEEGKPSKLPMSRRYSSVTAKISTNMDVAPKNLPTASRSSSLVVKASEQQREMKEAPDILQENVAKLHMAADNIVSSILTTVPSTVFESPVKQFAFFEEEVKHESPLAKERHPLSISTNTDLLELIDSALSTPGRRTSSSLPMRTPGTTPNSQNAHRWLTSSRKSSLTISDSSGTPTSSLLDKRGSLAKLEENGGGNGEQSVNDIISRFQQIKARSSSSVPLSPMAPFSPLLAAMDSTPTNVTPLKIPNLNEDEGTKESDNFEKINSSMLDLSMVADLNDIEELLDVSSILL